MGMQRHNFNLAAGHGGNYGYSASGGDDEDDDAFECSYCGAACKSESALKKHLEKNHYHSLPECNFCGERFTEASTRNEHIRETHHE